MQIPDDKRLIRNITDFYQNHCVREMLRGEDKILVRVTLVQVSRYISPARISRRWQAPGAVKKRKKIRKKIKKIVPVPICVFVDSEQKAEFKAKMNHFPIN